MFTLFVQRLTHTLENLSCTAIHLSRDTQSLNFLVLIHPLALLNDKPQFSGQRKVSLGSLLGQCTEVAGSNFHLESLVVHP